MPGDVAPDEHLLQQLDLFFTRRHPLIGLLGEMRQVAERTESAAERTEAAASRLEPRLAVVEVQARDNDQQIDILRRTRVSATTCDIRHKQLDGQRLEGRATWPLWLIGGAAVVSTILGVLNLVVK